MSGGEVYVPGGEVYVPGGEVYVPGGKAPTWFINSDEALEAAQVASEFANSGTLVNPAVAFDEAERLLEIAIAMESRQ